MTKYPLLFTFRDRVSGAGFLAEVVAHGRLLAVDEDDGWWMYGVQPGGLAEGGRTPADAIVEFRRSFQAVLYDIAAEAKTFPQFRAAVQKFFREKNTAVEAEWLEAVAEVRKGAVTPAGIPVGKAPIPKKPAESPRSLTVTLLSTVRATPKDNKVDPLFAVAA